MKTPNAFSGGGGMVPGLCQRRPGPAAKTSMWGCTVVDDRGRPWTWSLWLAWDRFSVTMTTMTRLECDARTVRVQSCTCRPEWAQVSCGRVWNCDSLNTLLSSPNAADRRGPCHKERRLLSLSGALCHQCEGPTGRCCSHETVTWTHEAEFSLVKQFIFIMLIWRMPRVTELCSFKNYYAEETIHLFTDGHRIMFF